MERTGNNLKITKNTYMSISLVVVLVTVVIFGVETRNATGSNARSIKEINTKMDSKFIEFRNDNNRIIESLNELRKIIYKVDGKLEIMIEVKQAK